MKLKTSELQGAALDWAVAKCELGSNPAAFDRFLSIFQYQNSHKTGYDWSTNWSLGGLIIEREAISVAADTADMFDSFMWFASVDDILVDADEAIGVRGPTPLVAAMRCHVANKMGDEVEVPDELLQGEEA